MLPSHSRLGPNYWNHLTIVKRFIHYYVKKLNFIRKKYIGYKQQVLQNYFFRFFCHVHVWWCHFFTCLVIIYFFFLFQFMQLFLWLFYLLFSLSYNFFHYRLHRFCLSQIFYSLFHNCLLPFTIHSAVCLAMCTIVTF